MQTRLGATALVEQGGLEHGENVKRGIRRENFPLYCRLEKDSFELLVGNMGSGGKEGRAWDSSCSKDPDSKAAFWVVQDSGEREAVGCLCTWVLMGRS